MLAVAAVIQEAYLGHPVHLDCGRVSNSSLNLTHLSLSGNAVHHVVVNGSVQNNDGRFLIESSSLTVREVKASDAGIYYCGENNNIYHSIRLIVSGE